MDPLAGLDFNAKEDVSGMFDYSVLSTDHSHLLADLEKASQEGNWLSVKTAFETLRRTNARLSILRKPGRALRLAVAPQRVDIIRYLLSQGVRSSATDIKIANSMKALPIIRLLLQHGWPINKQLGWWSPPALAYAVEDSELATWFLRQGADPNASCSVDKTPLSAAVQYGPLTVIELLFARGGDIGHGQLLHYAIWRERPDRLTVVKMILAKGAPVNAVMYQNHPDSYQQRRYFGLGTPLHDAAAKGDADILGVLVQHGADTNAKDTLGFLAHERAQRNGHKSAASYLLAQSVVPGFQTFNQRQMD